MAKNPSALFSLAICSPTAAGDGGGGGGGGGESQPSQVNPLLPVAAALRYEIEAW